MHITQIEQSGFKWNIRVDKCFQDERVIFEVIACDVYHIEEMAAHFTPHTILDIGGHIGTFGVFAKSFWPDARLVVVEPCADNLELYKLNAKTNGLKNVRFIHGAVAYNPDAVCLVNSPTSTGGHVLRTAKDAKGYVSQQYRFYNEIQDDHVKTHTVEQLTEEFQFVDLAKWDCEGGEVDAFLNMKDETAKKFRFMVGESHIWSDESEYLRPTIFECITFWKKVRQKFPHLDFNYEEKPLGNFQAWPKEIAHGMGE